MTCLRYLCSCFGEVETPGQPMVTPIEYPPAASVAFISPLAKPSGKKYAKTPMVFAEDKENAANFLSPVEKVRQWLSPRQSAPTPLSNASSAGDVYHAFSPGMHDERIASFMSPTGYSNASFMSPSNMMGSIFGRGQM